MNNNQTNNKHEDDDENPIMGPGAMSNFKIN